MSIHKPIPIMSVFQKLKVDLSHRKLNIFPIPLARDKNDVKLLWEVSASYLCMQIHIYRKDS